MSLKHKLAVVHAGVETAATGIHAALKAAGYTQTSKTDGTRHYSHPAKFETKHLRKLNAIAKAHGFGPRKAATHHSNIHVWKHPRKTLALSRYNMTPGHTLRLTTLR